MKLGYKTSWALVALLMIVGISANATRSGKSAWAKTADSDSVAEKTAAISQPVNEGSVVDEVIWVVGDEAILKSDVEVTRLQAEAEGIRYSGDPDCSIPEQIAVQKLFLHQAAIDSIEVSESEVMQGIDAQINAWVSMIGSREKLEEYRKQTITQMREQMHDDFKNQQLIQKMKQELVKNIKVSPAQVRKYFNNLPADSIPFVPTEVEVEILTMQPRIPMEEINRATPRTQSALLEAMQEHQITAGDRTMKIPEPFTVIATQNPIEQEGTYPLPEAELDRFIIKLNLGYPREEEYSRILDLTTGTADSGVHAVCSGEEVLEMRRTVRSVLAEENAKSYAVHWVMSTQPDSEYCPAECRDMLLRGAGPRAAQGMILMSKVYALLDGRTAIGPADLDRAALPVLRHRIALRFEAQMSGETPDSVLNRLHEGLRK